MNEDVSQILIGGKKVGVIGLNRIFSEVRELGLTDPVRIMAELLRRAHQSNYIPPPVERDYCDGLYREYRRFIGEDTGDEKGIMEIFVLGPGCPRCDELMRRVKNVAAEMNLPADIRHIHDLKQIASYGPAPTPGLVINGKLRSAGKVLSPGELKKLLESE